MASQQGSTRRAPPPAQPPQQQRSTGTAVAPYEQFRQELVQRHDEIATLLPSTISLEAFQNVAIIATKQTPELLDCDRRSLHKAVTMAARDGLMPDGREGVILPQNEKVKDKATGKEHWIKSARWQSMIYGVRKRARQIDGIIIDAQVVYQNDRFVWYQGDDARIEHIPAQLGTDRGKMIGAYAIFKVGNEVLHREVMTAAEIEVVHSISRSPEGLMWKKFTGEAWRKTVIRRGSKTLPCSDKLREVLERDDDSFDVSGRLPLAAPPPPPPPSPRIAAAAGAPVGEVQDAEVTEIESEPVVDPDRYYGQLEEELASCGDAAMRLESWEAHKETVHPRLSPEYQQKCEALWARHQKSG